MTINRVTFLEQITYYTQIQIHLLHNHVEGRVQFSSLDTYCIHLQIFDNTLDVILTVQRVRLFMTLCVTKIGQLNMTRIGIVRTIVH